MNFPFNFTFIKIYKTILISGQDFCLGCLTNQPEIKEVVAIVGIIRSKFQTFLKKIVDDDGDDDDDDDWIGCCLQQ